MTLPNPLDDTNTHRYIPNASADIAEMLATIGVDSIERLFDTIPNDVKLDRLLDLPGPWSEIESRRWFRELAARICTTSPPASTSSSRAPSSSPRTRRTSPRCRRGRCSRSSNIRPTSAS